MAEIIRTPDQALAAWLERLAEGDEHADQAAAELLRDIARAVRA
jgi:hypothetical protein